jgi:23S rRNA pseudouridine955/2504/2580 synthase/23S rRNA pseudouridine1911/1915/1917 synthase
MKAKSTRSSSFNVKDIAARYDIVYEDEALIVINKPAGLLAIPDRFNSELPSVRALLTERMGEVFIVHRIDRDTSGLLVAAKTAEAHRFLSEQFEARSVRKFYHAVVQGVVDVQHIQSMQQKETTPTEAAIMNIDIPLMPDPVRKGLMMPSVRGKESLTRVRLLERFRMATLLECELITGRQHQIRVHCAALGHPLLVDPEYGSSGEFLLSTIKRKYSMSKHQQQERPLITRLTLHAARLEFMHPLTNTALVAEAPYPKDFKALLQTLRKYAPFRASLPNSAALLEHWSYS